MAPSELARLSYTCLKGGNSPEPLEWVLEAYWCSASQWSATVTMMLFPTS